MNLSRIATSLLFLPLLGCAASWSAIDVYAPYDEARVVDGQVSVVRPLVTTRPDGDDDPWGRLASRFHRAILAEVDGPFVAVDEADPRTLNWSEDSWTRVDDVTDALLAHAANPFPQGEHRLQEGTPATGPDDAVGQDGYVLLVAVQPSMKETVARLMGVAGEVTRFSGFSEHLDRWVGDPEPEPDTRHDVTELEPPAGEPTVAAEPPKESREDRRSRIIGKQNRVDVAFLLVDRRSGRFVAAGSTRMEPINSPHGNYRGSIQRALRSWRLVEPPWTAELILP